MCHIKREINLANLLKFLGWNTIEVICMLGPVQLQASNPKEIAFIKHGFGGTDHDSNLLRGTSHCFYRDQMIQSRPVLSIESIAPKEPFIGQQLPM
jgi:hypothetical protein